MRPAEEPGWIYGLVQVVVPAVLRALWGVDARGFESLPPRGRVLVALNHVSWVDPFLAAMVVYRVRFPRWMAKEELFHNPFAAWFLALMGVIRLDRRGDVAAMRAAVEVLEGEGCLVLFPEGTRSPDGRPGRAKPGLGFLAHRTGTPVVPARVENTKGFPRHGRLGILFGPPMRYRGEGGRESYQAFADRVMEAIQGL